MAPFEDRTQPMQRMPPESFETEASTGPVHSKIAYMPRRGSRRPATYLAAALCTTAAVLLMWPLPPFPGLAPPPPPHSPASATLPSRPASTTPTWPYVEQLQESEWGQITILADDERFIRREGSTTWHSAAGRLNESDLAVLRRDGQLSLEVTRFPDRAPNASEVRTAEALMMRGRLAARQHGWARFERALAEGFTPMEFLKGFNVLHLTHEKYAFDGVDMDPERPEALVYANTSFGSATSGAGVVLIGMMFVPSGGDAAEGPQVAGPATRWHFHIFHSSMLPHGACFRGGILVTGYPTVRDGGNALCKPGEVRSRRSPEMLHLWLPEDLDAPIDSSPASLEATFATEMTPVWSEQFGWSRGSGAARAEQAAHDGTNLSLRVRDGGRGLTRNYMPQHQVASR